MKNLLAWLDVHFEDALCGVLLVGIMIMLMAQVVVRFAGTGSRFRKNCAVSPSSISSISRRAS